MINPKMIEGDDKVRVQKCMQDVNKVLESYDCALIPIITLSSKGVVSSQVAINPLPRGVQIPPEIQQAGQEAVKNYLEEQRVKREEAEKKQAEKKPMGPRPF